MRKDTNIILKVDPKTKNVTVFGLTKEQIEKVKSALENWLEEDKKESTQLQRVDFNRAFILRSNGSFKIKKPLLQIWGFIYYEA